MADADQELMRRFQEGDDSAFEVLVHKFQGLVLALVRRYLGSRYAGVDDVSQQVFVRIYRAKHTYEPRALVKTWIYSITVNACLNEIRTLKSAKHRRVGSFTAVFGEGPDDDHGAVLSDPHAAAPDAHLEGDEVAARVRAAVDRLPDQQRLALVLSRFHNCSYEDVAASMKTSVPAVKSLLTRARENLRKSLADWIEAGGAPSVVLPPVVPPPVPESSPLRSPNPPPSGPPGGKPRGEAPGGSPGGQAAVIHKSSRKP